MKKLLLFLLLVGAGLVGIAVWINYPRARTVTEKIFTYAAVEKGTMIETISATGVVQIEPGKVLVISSEMPGMVVAIRKKVTDKVHEGEVLLRLDDRKIMWKLLEAEKGIAAAQAGLDQAKAMCQAARLALNFQKEIEKKGGFRTEREQAEVKLKAAQAGVNLADSKLQLAQIAAEEAKLALAWTQIKVPAVSRSAVGPARAVSTGPAFSPRENPDLPALDASAVGLMGPALGQGLFPSVSALFSRRAEYTVMECNVKLGQQVGPGGSEPLFILAADLGRMEVHAQVAEGDIGKVKKGLKASFTVTAFSDENIEFNGQVKEIRPLPSNVKGAIYYDTVIAVKNHEDPETDEWRLRPGMTASVDIRRREHKNAWKMPTAALNFQMEEAYQSDAARERLEEWKKRPDSRHWKTVWTWDQNKGQPWPLFVRIGGFNKNGEPGLKDGGFNEVLEWEPDLEPADAAGLRVITDAPPATTPGFFDRPTNLKLS